MNLLFDPWIPVLRASGQLEDIAPWQITDENDPVVRLGAPRPDFNGALLQFFIGLLQTACTPNNDNDWADWLEKPPAPALLKEAFEPFAHAFEFDIDKTDTNSPSFMQDFEEIQGNQKPISNLLIDAPGAQTLKENKDHFVKRNHIQNMCPRCAAIALFVLQTNAPKGGSGHLTSLRGGGPLTALVGLDPKGGELPDDLWRFVWLNVSDQAGLDDLQMPLEKEATGNLFPWLAPTRTEGKSKKIETTPTDVHPLQAFWGMPRRIRLEPGSFKDTNEAIKGVICNICCNLTDQPVTHYRTQTHGTNYTGPWQHPLSPYTFKKEGLPLPKHPQPGGVTYKHWLELSTNRKKERASLPVRLFTSSQRKRRMDGQQLIIHAFGYDMSDMKARCWYEATFPLFEIAPTIQDSFFATVEKLVAASKKTANNTHSAVQSAWFKSPKDAEEGANFIKEAFFSATEFAFFEQLRTLAEQLQTHGEDSVCRHHWHKSLREASLTVFEHWADNGDPANGDPRRVCEARKALNRYLFSQNQGLARILEISFERQE